MRLAMLLAMLVFCLATTAFAAAVGPGRDGSYVTAALIAMVPALFLSSLVVMARR